MAPAFFGSGGEKPGLLERLRKAVASTKAQLVERLEEAVEGKQTVDPALIDDLEAALITADLGVRTTTDILARLRDETARGKLREAAGVRSAVEQEILTILERSSTGDGRREPSRPAAGEPEVIFMVGVNGVGKTTTIAKLARYYLAQNRTPLLAAADTFRAAATEQLEVWAGRLGVELIKQKPGSDPSAIVFDAIVAAKSRKFDPVIVDTAGRLHTKDNLMTELAKMCRTASRQVSGAPHQVLLVLDATTGQNGLAQARQFTEHAGATGIVLTKLDGTAKGGVVVAIARELGLPIQFVGIGEKLDDLLPFNPKEFVESLFES
jgi:fused signal recognition particle receptor